MRTTCLEFMIIPPYGATVNSVRRQCKAVGYKDRDHCGISDGLATLCCFLQQPLAPVLGNTSPMKYRQSFVDGKPYQPTAESALATKGRCVARSREQTIFYSNSGPVRIAKHAVCDRMEQAAISRRPSIRRPVVVRQNSGDRNSFVRVRLQFQCGSHFHS